MAGKEMIERITRQAEDMSRMIIETPITHAYDLTAPDLEISLDDSSGRIQFPGFVSAHVSYDPAMMAQAIIAADVDNFNGFTVLPYLHIRFGNCIGQTIFLEGSRLAN